MQRYGSGADEDLVLPEHGYRVVAAPGAGHGRSPFFFKRCEDFPAAFEATDIAGAHAWRQPPGRLARKVVVKGEGAEKLGYGYSESTGHGAKGPFGNIAVPIVEGVQGRQQWCGFAAPPFD